MAKKLSPKDAEKLRRRDLARQKRDPFAETVHYVCEDLDCPICSDPEFS